MATAGSDAALRCGHFPWHPLLGYNGGEAYLDQVIVTSMDPCKNGERKNSLKGEHKDKDDLKARLVKATGGIKPSLAMQSTKSDSPMLRMSSIAKACVDLSNGLRGLRLGKTSSDAATKETQRLKQIRRERIQLKAQAFWKRIPYETDLWSDETFLTNFFYYFSPEERGVLAQVNRQWRDILYEPHFWIGVTPVFNCRDWIKSPQGRVRFYQSLIQRGFDSLVLFGATDTEINEFVTNFSLCKKHIRSIALRNSNVSDAGLETLLEKMLCIFSLELSGCNEITEAGLWSCLNAKIVSLTISDCINVADDSVGAISQLLPALYELNLQAYHVTDAALSFFSTKQSYTLSVLRLNSCWEITNHGIVNIVHSLPNLNVLSLSGCSKITDDGVELIAENLRKLRSLDLSWCPGITDAALEYIACDLGQLEELVLDRCNHITDIGVGYLSTMTTLLKLFLRWCTRIRDFGLQHLYTMKNLKVLSLAGCTQLTSSGLSGLAQLRHLEELELTNNPGANAELISYLRENMNKCLVLD